ncbi:MAG: hypothetical protein CFE23_01185 [Flavobacterium sp. BFFFF1]|uniref:DUF6705 family protein n=1 Tax=Flavobacterium sp. BFFFF1 TaxID=2015557 RepID=UPI000BCFBEAF|nr:DUF6705 family protein [Flavobacterium sp. BFFFF1]OYU81948.1 MAG: hypothetical protein CFE23_01185 [Flavobacterium sp. BFFFF1]
MMKNIYLAFILITSFYSRSQITVGLRDGYWLEDMPPGSYIKDTNNEFDPFAGKWVWTNGDEKVIFKLEKVVHYRYPFGSYEDFMIGNYSYTKDNGLTIVANTINQSLSLNPDENPMFAFITKPGSSIDFYFNDIPLDKDDCRAIFEFIPGSTTQMTVRFKNPEVISSIEDPNNPSPPYNYEFTIPQGIILTKQ